MIMGTIFVGCNPLEDINNVVDAVENPVVGSTEYTLVSDDYTEDVEDGGLGLDFDSFSIFEDPTGDTPHNLLPAFLAEKYSHWGEGSSVLVGYDLYIGNAEGVSDYSGADVYQLSNADYASTGSDAFGFYPNVESDDHIPGVLDMAIADPTDGDIVLAKYKQYFEDPIVGLADLVNYNFAGSFEGWTSVEESGDDEVWTSEIDNVRGNGYFGDQFSNVEWLVSPSLDFSGESDLKFQITQELDFANDPSLLKIMVSTDYSGDVLTATWDEITLANPATSDMETSEDYDFSAYDGEIINIAFKYTSIGDDPATPGIDEGDAGRWRIESLAIKTTGVTGDTNSKGTHYAYDGGEWEAVDGVYFVSSADFDSMGEGSGQPGQYNNFGSSTPPGDYLSTFLSLTEPFAYGLEEDELIVVYDYFSSSSGAQIRGDRYTVIDGSWEGHESTIATTLQFGHDGSTWVPDNTIRYTLAGSDYSSVAAALLTEPGFETAAGNLGNYGNFSRDGGSSNWTDEMMVVALGIVLNNLDPGAAAEQKYVVTFDTWAPGDSTEEFALIKDVDTGEWRLQTEDD